MATTNAPVDLNEIDFNDENGVIKDNSPGDEPSIEPYYQIKNRYERDLHRYMMGISSPNGFQGASVAFVQLASPTLLWVAEWVATRLGGKPKIPNLSVQNPNWVLLDEHHEPGMVDVQPDGNTVYYPHRGVFVYGHINPSAQMIQDINYACPPWIDPNRVSRTVDQSQLEQNMIDAPNATQGGNNVNIQQPGVFHVQNGP